MVDKAGYVIRGAIGWLDNPRITSAHSGFLDTWWPPSQSKANGYSEYGALETQYPVSAGIGDIAGYRAHSFVQDFYNRIYVLPPSLALGLVVSETTVPVQVWNAYAEPSTLTGITIDGDPDTSVTGPVLPLILGAMQLQTLNVVVGMQGPFSISAIIQFLFTGRVAPQLLVTGQRGALFAFLPEIPVEEIWQWYTDIQVADSGEEQRIALMQYPRRQLSATLVATDKPFLRERMGQLVRQFAGAMGIPYFQYATRLQQPAMPGATELFFDPVRTDLRDGDYAILFNSETDYEMVRVVNVGAMGGELEIPIAKEFGSRALIVPVFSSLITNGYALGRWATDLAGKFTISTRTVEQRGPLAEPGYTETIPTYDGYDILDKRPLISGTANETYDSGVRVFDYDTGPITQVTQWEYTRVNFTRSFLTHRVTEPDTLHYWRLFLSRQQGMLKSFLMPSFRADFELDAPAAVATDVLLLKGTDFARVYLGAEPYTRLRLYTAAGTHDCTVVDATETSVSSETIQFTPALPGAPEWASISKISHLLKVRLSSDEVLLAHDAMDTTLTINFRTTPA